jgi:hypothetical protein
MPEMNIPPEFEQQLRQAMDVPEPGSADLNTLRERFITLGTEQLRSPNGTHSHTSRPARANPPRSWLFSLSLAWKFALLLLAVLVILAFFSPQVVNALRGLFGYIPNVGMVDQSAAVLVLDQPVQVMLDEISLTVERAYATSEKTVVVYQYKAPPWDGRRYQQTEPLAPGRPALLLPNGTHLEIVIGHRQPGDNGAIRYVLEFGPLPPNITTFTLQLDRLAGMPPDLSPKDISIPLRFKPGDPSEILFPVTVYEPTATVSSTATLTAAAPADTQPAPSADVVGATAEPNPPAAEPAARSTPAYGASILLEKSVELPDGYLLMGSFRWTDPSVGQNNLELGMPVISDANGQTIEYDMAPVDTYPGPGELRENWAYKIPGKAFAAPLRVEFYVTLHESASVPFQFDPGPNPLSEQTYDLNIELPVNAHRVKIVSGSHQKQAPNNHIFLFTLTADTYVIGARIIDPAHPPMGGGGGGNGIPLTAVPFSSGLFLQGDLPQGPLSLQISGLDVLIPGDWVITWSPNK